MSPDTAASHDGNGFSLETVGAPFPVCRRLHRAKYAVRGNGRRIAGLSGEAGDVRRLHVHEGHVLRAGAHVFCRYVAAAKTLDETTVGAEDPLAIHGLVVADDDGLAAAKVKSCDGVLVRHSPRKSECIRDRFLVAGVLPEPRPAEGWPELRAMDCEDSPVPHRGIAAHHDLFVSHLCQSIEQLHLVR